MEIVKTVHAAEVANVNGVATLRGLEGIFQNAVGAILSLAAIVVFIMLIIGGLKYLTSGGDPKAVESAEKTLTSAIIGIIVIALSFLILRLIEEFTGAEVTNFVIYR